MGAPVVTLEIDHGKHPAELLFTKGYVPTQPLSATLVDGEIVLTFLVRPLSPRDRKPRRRRILHRDPATNEVPVKRQRIGAYAVVISSRGVLGTVNSSLTGAPNTWALPGGGVDQGESPAEAVIREIYEETGQHVRLERLLSLESDHWIGRSLDGTLEDFHALRVIYAATCDDPSDPVVHDHGGSTAAADWVSLRGWRGLRWTLRSRTLLSRYLRQLTVQQTQYRRA